MGHAQQREIEALAILHAACIHARYACSPLIAVRVGGVVAGAAVGDLHDDALVGVVAHAGAVKLAAIRVGDPCGVALRFGWMRRAGQAGRGAQGRAQSSCRDWLAEGAKDGC